MWDMPFLLQRRKNREKMHVSLALLLTHGLCQGHLLAKTNPTVKTAKSAGWAHAPLKKNCRPQAQAGADDSLQEGRVCDYS